MIEKLNKSSYLNGSITELEKRLEMQSLTPLGVCLEDYCDTWNCGPKCPEGFAF